MQTMDTTESGISVTSITRKVLYWLEHTDDFHFLLIREIHLRGVNRNVKSGQEIQIDRFFEL
jgi:hypothetical protein